MTDGTAKEAMLEFVCPGCGYKTIKPRDESIPRTKLGDVSGASAKWVPDELMDEEFERAETTPKKKELEPEPTIAEKTVPKKKKMKVELKKIEVPAPKEPDPPAPKDDIILREFAAEVEIVNRQLASLEKSLQGEIKKLRSRLEELGEKLENKMKEE